MKTAQDQTQALSDILLQLQLASSRITDEHFKKYGNKDLMSSIQNCKKLIELSKQLSLYQEIQAYAEVSCGYSDSLGISNIV